MLGRAVQREQGVNLALEVFIADTGLARTNDARSGTAAFERRVIQLRDHSPAFGVHEAVEGPRMA